MKAKHWYDRLYWWPVLYFSLGFFNILFAWLGMIDFLVPVLLAVWRGNKAFCNRYCGRGRLLAQLGGALRLSRNVSMPALLVTKYFRRGFLLFFCLMFGSMLWQTYQVAAGAASLRQALTLFWAFRVPWAWADSGLAGAAVTQFSYGFYSLMLTSTLIGLIAMALWKPRSWCVFCPMGTLTQEICRWQSKGQEKE